MKTVVIISCGIKTEQGQWWLEDARDLDSSIFDVRQAMPFDPSVHVQHKEDGTTPNCQRSVFAQEGSSRPSPRFWRRLGPLAKSPYIATKASTRPTWCLAPPSRS